MNDDFIIRAKKWFSDIFDEKTKEQVKKMLEENNTEELKERFSEDLKFGTGGMRGKMGIGTNRMNIYTVGIATQGFAKYLLDKDDNNKGKGIVIAHDPRHNSTLFTKRAACVLAANNIKTYIFDGPNPTPLLSFAVRYFNAAGGIVITASHNPPEYNGYKAYLEDGGQLVSPEDEIILNNVEKTSYEDVKTIDERSAIEKGLIITCNKDVERAYLDVLMKPLIYPDICKEYGPNLKTVYSPLHGAGYKLAPQALNLAGFTDIISVAKQAEPNGDFPTVTFPNPEDPEAWKLIIETSENINADLAIANDPDADRVGIAVKDNNGKYILLNGNQTGALIVYHVLSGLKLNNKLPENPYIIKTIVTSELWRKIADKFNVKIFDVLTGFKYIGEMITRYNKEKEENKTTLTYILGGEESYGYMIGDHVRDKDGINAAIVISEIAALAFSENSTIYQKLQDIYSEFGLHIEKLKSFYFEGLQGRETMENIMKKLRDNPPTTICNSSLIEKRDYLNNKISNSKGEIIGKTELPKSNVISVLFADGTKIVARPSGTEPKIKFYFFVNESDKKETAEVLKEKIDHIEMEFFKHLDLK